LKLFYITTLNRLKMVRRSWHVIDLGNDKVLACIDWKECQEESVFASFPDVICLPHPIFESRDNLTAEHVKHLSGKFTATTDHNIHHIIQQAVKEDLWMRIRVL